MSLKEFHDRAVARQRAAGQTLKALAVEAEANQPGSKIQCPHCGVTGQVRTKETKQKRGISGGKATGAVLTAGVSILATGLSRKQKVMEAHCKNCGSRWLL